MRISDWSSDVCSSDLGAPQFGAAGAGLDPGADRRRVAGRKRNRARLRASDRASVVPWLEGRARRRGAAYLAAAGRDLRLGPQSPDDADPDGFLARPDGRRHDRQRVVEGERGWETYRP